MKVFLSFLFLLSALTSSAQPKIGVINMDEVYLNYHLKLKIEKDVQAKIEALKTSSRVVAVQETDAKLKDLAKTVRDKTLAAETRELAAEEFNSLAIEHQSLIQEMERYLADEKQKATRELVESLEEIIVIVRKEISKVCREENYDFVLENAGKTSSQISPVIYLRNKTDITSLIVERLNKSAPADTPNTQEAE
ncbi:MAG: OmpH family outer membrane protein [Roseibacillus sp.]